MNYEQMLKERMCSPSSRIVRISPFFDEQVGWNATDYHVIYKREDGLNFWNVITVRTLSQMDVE